ncbi:hypothetical protein KVT40_007604 [Elsinoe batatas]|uniref:DUF7580 domain-containing protein n=1 Tax=Elsinoe batatas TaxID=2601811 RepID=A0A8K0KVY8_9PEZI|nr:hypothetical protein KVT40_007604 [Elsinoe batatas]
MSGIEVAGLVLAAIPLIISALEHESSDGSGIYSTHLNTSERQDMLENSASQLWQNADINQSLIDHLQGRYASYMRTVREIERIICLMAAKVENAHGLQNLDREGLKALVSHQPPAKVQGRPQKFQFSQAIRFTMSKRKLSKLSEELKENIDFLDSFQDKADKIIAIEADSPASHQRQSKLVLHIETVRSNAEKLHNALSSTFCSAHASHSAGLLLEQKFTRKVKRRDPGWQALSSRPQTCDVSCFGRSVSQAPGSVLKKWLDLEIRLAEAATPVLPASTMVKFSVLPPQQIPSTVVTPYHDPAKLQVITDICSELQTSRHTCVGFCIADHGHLRGGYDAQRQITYVDEEVTLQQILAKQPGSLRQLERYHLAIALTVALLQLSHTSWLKRSWNKASIVFLRAKQSRPRFGLVADVTHPYLVREHEMQTASTIATAKEATDSSKIAALGIMLLEVCEGVPIEDFIEPADLGPNGQPNEMSYMVAARRYLSQDPTDGISQYAFGRAIEYCLKCFWEPRASLADPAFAKSVEENVLVPLEQEMNTIKYGPATR